MTVIEKRGAIVPNVFAPVMRSVYSIRSICFIVEVDNGIYP